MPKKEKKNRIYLFIHSGSKDAEILQQIHNLKRTASVAHAHLRSHCRAVSDCSLINKTQPS